jgi:uncharacterized protein YjbJ (UPF0337 family)
LTGDDDLKNEGKVDRAEASVTKASVKNKVDRAADRAKEALNRDEK